MNDLLEAAVTLAPELDEWLSAIRRTNAGGACGLTGSGPTLYVLLESGADPADEEERLRRVLPPSARLLVTRTVGAAEYHATRFGSPEG